MLCVDSEDRGHAVHQEILNEPNVNVIVKGDQKDFHLLKKNISLVGFALYISAVKSLTGTVISFDTDSGSSNAVFDVVIALMTLLPRGPIYKEIKYKFLLRQI